MRHILCVHIKNWPINRLKRRHPALQDKPVAIVETLRGKQIIVACCKFARAHGVHVGMTFAQARAFCAGLIDRPHRPDRDRKALEALARWMIRFTPVVSIEGSDALLLDVTGCDRLFVGWESLIEQAFTALQRFRIGASLVLAPTPGAAWAIASNSPIHWRIVRADALDAALSPLPISALRVDAEILDNLQRVGIETIGQLRSLSRDALPSRFGPTLLHRLDQAIGTAPEALQRVTESETVAASIELEEAVESLEIIWEIVRELVDRVSSDLLRRGCGARRMLLRLYQAYDVPIEQTVSLARPSRDAKNLFNLLRCSLESLQAVSGFNRVDLTVSVVQKLAAEQITIHDHAEQDARFEWSSLIERLQARLGPDAVTRPQWSESHLPEHSCVDQPATMDAPEHLAMALHDAKPMSVRPLCLLRHPSEIGVIVSPSEDREGHPIAFTYRGVVHRLRFAVGPERISGPWWDGRDKTRDYFEVEDEIGLRFWLFRVIETWKWYLHGRFE